ncbi:MAG: hypothetical protein SGBAC_007593 [Bacillariaceae sp.]
MGIIDKRRTRWKDLLFRRSSASSRMLKDDVVPQKACSEATLDHPPAIVVLPLSSSLMNKSEHAIISSGSCFEKTGSKQELDLPSRSSRRVISFSSKYECGYIPERTGTEKAASFYSKEEYDRIDSDNADTIMEMEIEKQYPESETQYHRGLLIPRARYEREQRIKFVVSKVLREQERNKTISEDWANQFSKRFSSQTTIAALCLGKIDAKAAGRATAGAIASPKFRLAFGLYLLDQEEVPKE